MVTLTLTRKKPTGKAVCGFLVIPFSQLPYNDRIDDDAVIDTLENADFIIPPGTYKLKRTYSPKFKKLLPLVQDVPDREGIRIHKGSKPEHSTGCILTDLRGMALIDVLFNRLDFLSDDDEEVQLEIFDPLCSGT